MILTCPSCATSYFTPDEAIGANGRTVRCKSCKHTWRATLDEPLELSRSAAAGEPVSFGHRDEPPAESLAATPAPELPKAFRARAEQQRRLRRAATHGVVWAGIASGFAALLGAAWLFRIEVVEAAPRAAAAYAAVGLTVNPTGLDFEAISARADPNDPGKVLVSGALRNVRDNERIAPPVRVALLDAHGAEIGHAIVRIDAAPVLPGKVQGFAVTISDPGARGQGIDVAFVLDEAAGRPAAAARSPAVHADTRRPPAAGAHTDPAPVPAGPASEAAPAAHDPVGAEASGLRPALSLGDLAPLEMHPIDAVPVVDTHGKEAVSASHG
jgi:predicted Zn finger-like uncharacterized protein